MSEKAKMDLQNAITALKLEIITWDQFFEVIRKIEGNWYE